MLSAGIHRKRSGHFNQISDAVMFEAESAVETCSQEPLSCSTQYCEFYYCCVWRKNIYAYNVTQRDGFRQVTSILFHV